MRILLAVTAALLAGACVPALDRAQATDFRPTGNDTFSFRAPIALQYPDTPGGEADRMEMLKGWMANNSMCSHGYEITSRQVVNRSAVLGDVHYLGKCKA